MEQSQKLLLKSKSKTFFLICFALAECIVVFSVCLLIYKSFLDRQREEILNLATVMDKNKLVYPSTTELKYYYEFKANTTAEDNPNWLSKKAHYSYNNDGLNERYDYEVLRKEKSVFRIVTLGDSFTYGHYVSTLHNWTELLEDKLKNMNFCGREKIEVINLGSPAFDVQYSAHKYNRVGKKYSPDLIIWFESGTGFTRLNEVIMPLIVDCEKQANEVDPEKKKEVYFICWDNANAQVIRDYSEQETKVTPIL